MIRFHEVSKYYPQTHIQAVANVSLEIKKGETLALVGASGCGKTTLLKMVNRLVLPTSGYIALDNQDIQTIDLKTLRRRFAYVSQTASLFPHLTVFANVALPLLLMRIPTTERQHYVQAALTQVGLDNIGTDLLPHELSGGQQQRICLARALVSAPETLLLDEPFSALDAITRQDLQRMVKTLVKERHLTVILVTHDLLEAMYLGNQVAVMNEGRIEQTGSPEMILCQPATPYVRMLTDTPALEVLRG